MSKPRPGQPVPPKPRFTQPPTDRSVTISPYRMRVLMTIGQARQDGSNSTIDMAMRTNRPVGTFMNTVNELQVAGLVSRSFPLTLTSKGRAVWNAVRQALGLATERAPSETRGTNIRPMSQILRGTS